MDTTLNTFKALQGLRESNDALSDDDLDAARIEGAKAMAQAAKRGEPIFLMDECSTNALYNAYAIGWNSESIKTSAKG